jgi:hypothetical protein
MITLVATAAAPAPKHNRLGSILKPRRELSVESIQAAAAERVRLAQAAELAAGPRISMSIEFKLS